MTPEGVILVDDKYPENLSDVSRPSAASHAAVRYVLNSHHHGDHVAATSTGAMGIDIIAHRNIRENFLRLKQPGEPNIVF